MAGPLSESYGHSSQVKYVKEGNVVIRSVARSRGRSSAKENFERFLKVSLGIFNYTYVHTYFQ